MPTYDYLCKNCDHEFEQFQSITADSLKDCPKCGKGELKRLIGAGSGIIFKGSGFYQTDYRSESYTNGQKKDKGTPAKKEKTKDTKSDKSAKAKSPDKSKPKK